MEEDQLRVRVFGGLEVWYRGRRWRKFETRKAAALFGYLIVNAGRQVSRDSLAALLWPDVDEVKGRQSLRQALYSIAATLPHKAVRGPILNTEGERVGINPQAGVWSDISEFLRLLGGEGGLDVQHGTHVLSRAVQLYRGALLDGIEVRGAAEYELWLVSEQERFRYLALDALQSLATAYMVRGEYRLGTHYARRLVGMDPFREEGHRLLMSLLAAAGNRAGAVSHYHSLVTTLRCELGASPAPQTAALYQHLLKQGEPLQLAPPDARPRPLVPLVGRERELERLRESWDRVCGGEGLVTVLEGEPGTGKTRLLRSFLDELIHKSAARVVAVATEPRRVQVPFAPLDQVLSRLCREAVAAGRDPAGGLDPPLRCALAALVGDVEADVDAPPSKPEELSIDLLAEGCTAVIRAATQPPGEAGSPIILFLDNMHYAPASGLALLREVARRLAHEPVWFVASCDEKVVARRRGLADACAAMAAVTHLEVLALGRLDTQQIASLAFDLLAEADHKAAAERLERLTGGLPLGIVMQVNLWWDEGVLTPAPGPGVAWELQPDDAPAICREPFELAQRRVAHASPFLRRILTLAAILGAQFDGTLLADLEGESRELVASALDQLVERWFLLSASRDWTPGRRQQAPVLGEGELGAARFEFDHEVLRRAVLARVSPERRRALHRQVAHYLERVDPSIENEILAHHYIEAGDYPQALAAVRRAIRHRGACGVSPSCLADLVRTEKGLTRACRRYSAR